MPKLQVILFLGCLAGLGQDRESENATGVIRGIVVNNLGRPVVGAKVHVTPAERRLSHTLIRYIETGDGGLFVMENLKWGEYKVYAMKESEGYPDTSAAIYTNGRTSIAVVHPQNPTAAVVVVIGPKAGAVTGSIVDAGTGTPVSTAAIRIWLWSKPEIFRAASTLPNYHILLPPETEVGIEVRASGYKSWNYPADPARGVNLPLSVKSGQELKLEIRLEKDR